MAVRRLNHAVLYVRDARAQQRFYADVLGFTTVVGDDDGRFAFMRAPASENHHDIAFFSIGADARNLFDADPPFVDTTNGWDPQSASPYPRVISLTAGFHF